MNLFNNAEKNKQILDINNTSSIRYLKLLSTLNEMFV